ncbi:hypothetical protein QBC46DRAFT_460230 [Diplogelasinospora grovesii]|uniref:DJ-1/PfpI domain-containing protein n=1 Tax=Diplogelasinospora grovesii TaxID=303347 RepID=A0AAN6N4U5_9PEZI|nr:hypothetical protein QBC46DRAFT_460230 [Diplogelasinospora grovesii]
MYNIGNQGKIMRKFLGKPTAESGHDSAAGITSSPIIPQYRPTASQNVVYPAGVPIACLDRSQDGHSAVLGGRHVLKTVYFDGLAIKEGIDLRAQITAQLAPKNGALSASVADQLSIKDVKWGTGHGSPSSTIFTACASGKIFQYDLTRVGSGAAGGSGLEFIQIREDSRQVNTLDINPHRGTYLLSGSQDGIVRCFDIRMPVQTRNMLTFRAVQAFKCNADGVRHVQWSPKDGFFFACGTEQGVVLKWDIRKATAPMLRINAHEKICSAVAWHPDGEHLISAGWDSKCNIWDMSKTADKRQKPKWSISTPAPVSTLAWRPGQWSATAQAKRASQIAVAYDESSQKRFGISAVHIWDLARPTMPYKEIQRFDSSPSALLWHDQYLLWTAGQDGIFSQCDVTYSPKVIDRQAVSTMAFSSQGDVVMFLDERAPSHHRPRPHIMHHDGVPLSSYGSSPTAPRFSISRSDSEDDAVGSFLGSQRRGSRRRRPSTRSAQALSTTPPSGPGMEDVLGLEQTIKVTGIYRPQQAMAIGHVPAAASVDTYQYLSVNYLEILHKELPYTPGGRSMVDRVATILDHYAKAAEGVQQFRLAQTWRILAYAVDLLLRRRAQYHLEARMDRLQDSYSTKKKPEKRSKGWGQPFDMAVDFPIEAEDDVTPRKILSSSSLDKSGHPRSLLSEELESTSNVPTPLVRPVRDGPDYFSDIYDSGRGKKLTPILEPESFTLPPALHPHSFEKRKRLDSEPLSITSHDSGATQASTEGYDFYDTDALSRAIDVPLPRQNPSLPLGYAEPGSPNRRRKPMLRQDSDEGYGQVFSLSDASRQTTGLTSSSDGSVPRRAARASSALAEIREPSGGEGGEFESRIRGKQIEESPARRRLPGSAPFRAPLERTETGLTTFTDEHHLLTQTTSDSFDSTGRGFPSQTDDGALSFGSPQRGPPSIESIDFENDRRTPYIIEADHLCWSDDSPYPHPVRPSPSFSSSVAPPLQPCSLITQALLYEAKKSALNASAIVLVLKPLVPDDVIDPYQAAAILRQHHSRLMNMKLFVEAALLRKLCTKGWPGAPLSSWGDNYPAIFTQAQQGVQAALLCSNCRKPHQIDRIWCCQRCKTVMAPCAVCGHRDTTPNLPPTPLAAGLSLAGQHGTRNDEDQAILATWWYCPGCGHGGHSACLEAWHSIFDSDHYGASEIVSDFFTNHPDELGDGCCPLDGCGHACLPGRWRAESAAARTEEITRVVREATRAGALAPATTRTGTATPASTATTVVGPGVTGAGESEAQHPAAAAADIGLPGVGTNMAGHHHGVRGDGNEIAQSRAVESVRETLAAVSVAGSQTHSSLSSAGIGAAGSTISSILSSSPGGRSGFDGKEFKGERERRKSVKFVATEDTKYYPFNITMMTKKVLRIGVMLEAVQLSDIVGIDILGNLSKMYMDAIKTMSPAIAASESSAVDMEFLYIATTLDPNATQNFLTPNLHFVPTVTYDDCPRDLDIIIIGGPLPSHRPPQADKFMKEAWTKTRVWMTTCIGSIWLASTGVLEGKKCTTNWGVLGMARQMYPDVEWVDQRWVVDEKPFDGGNHGSEGVEGEGGKGELWTAGGAGAGIDMIANYALQNFDTEFVKLLALEPLQFDPAEGHGQFYTD